MKSAYIVYGPPGSGKSSNAYKIIEFLQATASYEADEYSPMEAAELVDAVEDTCVFMSSNEQHAHKLFSSLAEKNRVSLYQYSIESGLVLQKTASPGEEATSSWDQPIAIRALELVISARPQSYDRSGIINWANAFYNFIKTGKV